MRIRQFSGFTILEMMIVISIIAILASIALPSLLRGREAALVRDAGVVLQGIRHAENSFLLDNDSYGNLGNLVAARNLAADPSFQTAQWAFKAVPGGPPPTFTAIATRTGGPWNTKTVIIDQNGTITGSHEFSKYAEF